MDVTNPGLVSVADQTYGNPDPNNGITLLTPEELDELVAAGNQGYPPAGNGVDSQTFPTPAEVTVGQVPTVATVLSNPTPSASNVNVDDVVIGQGIWKDVTEPLTLRTVTITAAPAFAASVALNNLTTVGVRKQGDPDEFEFGLNLPITPNTTTKEANSVCAGGNLTTVIHLLSGLGPVTFADLTAGGLVITARYNNGSLDTYTLSLAQLQAFGAVSDIETVLGVLPAAGIVNFGKKFVPPSDFIVVGPSESFQTNVTEDTIVTCTVTAVYDADDLYNAPSSNTTRFMLVVAAPALTSYPVTILGRQVTFTEDTPTIANQGANRIVTGFSTNFIVIDREDPTEDGGSVSYMTIPQVGDTFLLDVQRAGSEQLNTVGMPAAEVNIFPPPPSFVPNASQALQDRGNVDISTGPQPGQPIITSGIGAPTAINVFVADQSTSVGLPVNVNI